MACAGASSDEEIEVMEEIELSSDEDNVDDDEEVSYYFEKTTSSSPDSAGRGGMLYLSYKLHA